MKNFGNGLRTRIMQNVAKPERGAGWKVKVLF